VRFLIDTQAEKLKAKLEQYPDLVAGQLLTPLTRYRNWGGVCAIDNGAFSGFDASGFESMLAREEENRDRCLFVVVPDVVASARRTLEIWKRRHRIVRHWPLAFVAQDGIEDLEIPWDDFDALFLGGGDPWKDSKAAKDVCKASRILGKHVHIGRVNTIKRYKLYAGLADTCDGSGVAMYDHMLADIARELSEEQQPLFANQESI